MASSRASSSGRSGTLNGSLVMITFCSALPGTSTPCQKLSVPSNTPRGLALNRRSSGCAARRRPGSTEPDRARPASGDSPAATPHHLVAGEQHEGVAVGPADVAADHFDGVPLVAVGVR